MKQVGIFKIIFGFALGISGLVQVISNETWWFIQNVNLIFHEAGHFIFWVFGDFMSILGGSLLEILIPIIVIVHFVLSKQFFSAAFSSWWLSTALLSVSIYAADAQERILPLITNDINSHDWFNILLQLNMLQHDDLIGFLFRICSFLSIALLVFFLSKDKNVVSLLHRHALR